MEIPITKISTEEEEERLNKKLQERVDINLLVANDNKKKDVNRAIIYEECKNDFIYWCNNFAWLQDPEGEKPEDKEIPFILYTYQEESARAIIRAIQEGYDIPIEKSRKMGLSWLIVAIIVWGWHFQKWDCLLGSEKADKVDKRGDMGTLIEKARYIIRMNPKWLMPQLDAKKYDKFMLLVHPKHGAKIKGDTNSVDFGRGDRAKVVLLDEFTAWDQTDKQAWTSSSSTAKCRIALSTPNYRGKNCYYYQVVKNAKDKGLPYLRLHWTLNPVFADGLYYDDEEKPRSPWYDNECKRSSSLKEVSQELDIDYEASAAGKVFPEFDYDSNIVSDITYDPNLPLYIAWDFGLDQTALLWIQPDNRNHVIYIIDEYVNDGDTKEGSDIYHYLDIIDSKGYGKAIHLGDPHSGNNRSLTARGASNAEILRRQGIIFKSQRVPIKERILAGRNLIKQLKVSEKCVLTIDMFTGWQLKQPKTGNTNSSIPVHDGRSHLGDAYTYFAIGYTKPRELKQYVKKTYSQSGGGVTL